jgi:hypothetical protein
MFTLEIGGRPIAAINSRSKGVAQEVLGDPHFREELRSLVDGLGARLWDGAAPIRVRESLCEEATELKAAFQAAVESGAASPEDEDAYVVFLLPIHDAKAG